MRDVTRSRSLGGRWELGRTVLTVAPVTLGTMQFGWTVGEAGAPDPEADDAEWLGVFSELQAAGKIRHVATSNFCGFEGFGDLLTPLLDLASRTGLAPVAVEQSRYHLLNRREFEEQLQQIALRDGIGVLTYSSLAGGFLAGRCPRGTAGTGDRGSHARCYCNEAGWALLDELMQIAEDRGVLVAAIALAWTLAQPWWESPAEFVDW
jgi:aryl-alcohol dehydrogenase-like predicted oxidoreductase